MTPPKSIAERAEEYLLSDGYTDKSIGWITGKKIYTQGATDEREIWKGMIQAFEDVTDQFLKKTAVYMSIYPDDKELQQYRADAEAVLFRYRGRIDQLRKES